MRTTVTTYHKVGVFRGMTHPVSLPRRVSGQKRRRGNSPDPPSRHSSPGLEPHAAFVTVPVPQPPPASGPLHYWASPFRRVSHTVSDGRSLQQALPSPLLLSQPRRPGLGLRLLSPVHSSPNGILVLREGLLMTPFLQGEKGASPSPGGQHLAPSFFLPGPQEGGGEGGATLTHMKGTLRWGERS